VPFKINRDLTGALRFHEMWSNSSTIDVGNLIHNSMYSVTYLGRAGLDDAPVTIRFYKHLGPNDILDRKKGNIEREIGLLDALTESGVRQALLDLQIGSERQGVEIRNVQYTGPQDSNGLTFWETPIEYEGNNFIGYQVCDYIPDTSLNNIHPSQATPDFVTKIAQQFGETLAVFHHAAREVAFFPRYETEADLGKFDHAYRHIRDAEKNTQATELPSHRELAEKLYQEVMPLYAADADKSTWRPIHGDPHLGAILVNGEQLSGLVHWNKVRNAIPEYDFRGMAVIPGALDIAVDVYEKKMRALGEVVTIDRAVACKLALCVDITHANPVPEAVRFDRRETRDLVITKGLIGMNTILEQLAVYDANYAKFRDAVRPQVQQALEANPEAGLTLQ